MVSIKQLRIDVREIFVQICSNECLHTSALVFGERNEMTLVLARIRKLLMAKPVKSLCHAIQLQLLR